MAQEDETSEGQEQQHPTFATIARPLQDGWSRYCELVRQNEGMLHLINQSLSTALFWTPSSSQRREVWYGLLTVHHMLMDSALQSEEERDSYGTTVCPNTSPILSANAVRRLLTLTHSLLPAVLELCSSNPTKARLILERIKFALRVLLLVSYWKQIRNEEEVGESSAPAVVGLLRQGGFYHPELPYYCGTPPTVKDQQHRVERNLYVGRRTGRRVVVVNRNQTESAPSSRQVWLRLVVGELLHAYRPLFWARAEYDAASSHQSSVQWQSWLLSVAMDLVSLQCLKGVTTSDNPWGQSEWNRRRLKLFLYLLRSPAWDRGTHPAAERTAATVERVPLLGRVMAAYLREWLVHWKHPLFTEEG